MISFAFTRSNLLISLVIGLASIAAITWSQARGTPLPLTAFLSLCIAIANALVNGYYNAKRERQELEARARIEAQPFLELKSELIRELSDVHNRVQKLQKEAARLEAAATIKSLDREAVQSLLLAVLDPLKDQSGQSGLSASSQE